mgnify:FL=1|jgi:hypothetical protein
MLALTVVQNGLELSETESLEDEGAERGDTSGNERDAEDHDDEEDGLGVGESLSDVGPLELVGLGSSVVETDSLEGNVLLLLGEPLDSGRVSGEEEPGGDGKGEREETDTEEDDLVLVQDVRLDVTETVGQEGTEDSGHSVHRVPDVVPEDLFSSSPPHGRNDKHRGGDGGLESTEEESQGSESGKVLHSSHDDQDDGPGGEASADPVVDGDLDEGVDGDYR